ncbi:MAG: SIMPL domain-containing protein [Phycisphaerae bacterium]
MLTRVALGWGVVGILTAAAVAADGPTVQVRGTGRQRFQPTLVRVRWRVYAYGKSARSALKKLKACRSELEKRMAGLDEPRPAHRFGEAVEHQPSEGRMAQMQAQMMRAAMGQGGGDDDKPKDRVRLAMPVLLEWNLAGRHPEDQQREIDAIRDQLRDMEVLKTGDEDEDDSADDEEDDTDDGGSNDADPVGPRRPRIRIEDGPTFYYVRRLTDDDMNAVARLAFENARSQAARLAWSAGRSLGTLQRISDSIVSNVNERQRVANEMVAVFGRQRPRFDDEEDRPEAELVSDKLKPIAYHMEVTATFTLKGLETQP